MSRGYGRTMQRVLSVTEGAPDRWWAIADIAGPNATRSQIESVRRACKRLAEEKRVWIDYTNWSDYGQDEPPPHFWSHVIREKSYPEDARPASPNWQLAVRARSSGGGKC